jgi:galactose mutarotase-like enzyme
MSETDSHKSLFSSENWRQKVSNAQQIGGIETAVLDNGQGKGTRIAWFNTGSGLRFKVVLDRAMDIADAFYGSHSLAWISHSGVTPPNPAAVEGATWLDSFGGGLLTTCGLTHVGGPEEDEHGVRGLHDRISHTPAAVETIQQPDLSAEHPEMSITAKILQSTVFGPHLELKRTISARLGESTIHIHDEVTNLGNEPAPHMILYHCNFGWPLVDEGAILHWEGDWEAPDEQSRQIFNASSDFKKCSPPLDAHSGGSEAVAFIDPKADDEGVCRCGIENPSLGLKLSMEFEKEQFPCLTNWQHWGRKEYVTALEPCTHPPIGQTQARADGTLIRLDVEETRTYDITFSVEG